jgi:hypothetical protein
MRRTARFKLNAIVTCEPVEGEREHDASGARREAQAAATIQCDIWCSRGSRGWSGGGGYARRRYLPTRARSLLPAPALLAEAHLFRER